MSTADWVQRAEALRDELVAAGKVSSPHWQAAVAAVPRHRFVPAFFQRAADGLDWELVSESDPATRQRWWQAAYANTSLVTQLGEVATAARVTIGPTSSSSAPGLMTRMLEMLDIADGQRVLEIGTGTGYNAALLSHRLGEHNVYTVEVDPELADQARERLADAGYYPTVIAADGASGLAGHAPYDRIIATCAVSRVPWTWAEQTVEGGRILVDLKIHTAIGNLVLLHRSADRLEGRFDAGYATFMHIRTRMISPERPAASERQRTDARCRTTTLLTERVWENPVLWFLLHLHEPGRVDFGYTMDPDNGGPGPVFFTSSDGSWCELPASDGPRQVWEGGRRNLWANIEAVSEFWHENGQPGWDRFGLTVHSDDDQTVWLDGPKGEHQWSL